MSYQLSRADQQSRAMAQLADLQDYDRVKFLRWLADAAADETVRITKWETDFLATFFQAHAELPGVRVITFTPRQRESIELMRTTYGGPR